MKNASTSAAYWAGFRQGAPFVLIVAPFGMLFGVLSTDAGLNVVETLTFAITVFAGAAQLTALQMLQENAPTLIALLSALAVNLRVAMYSASLTPYMGAAPLWQRAMVAYFTVDQSYALAVSKFEVEPDLSVQQRVGYFMGTVTPIVISWSAAALAGALLGAQIPDGLALDFALPITFIAIVAPMLRTGAHVAAAGASVMMALLFAWLPFNLGLMVGGLSGMMVGARVELLMQQKGTWHDR